VKNSSFITSALATTLLLVGCSSSDDDSDASDTLTLTDGTVVECGTAEASDLSETDGDLSDDFTAPTAFTIGPGVNTVTASTQSGDLDYLTFTVGPCDTLTQLTVDSYTAEAGDAIAFIAVQSGSAFTFPAAEAGDNTGELLGFSHYGMADIGQDILPRIGEEEDALGFTPPLQPGDYTVWLNQTGTESEATLVFLVDRGQP